MNNADIIEKIRNSQMVLVGLGEEFDDKVILEQSAEYGRGKEILKTEELKWLLPAWNEFCSEKLGGNRISAVLEKLTFLLKDKNYFVVSVSANSQIAQNPWKNNRLVMPCGTTMRKQCSGGCRGILYELTDTDRERTGALLENLWEGRPPGKEENSLGTCPECGAPLILNHVYGENYNEEGYLEQWQTYTKWLQGTLNRSLFVLELGVGMEYPSVIRWPFEKAAFFNKKAFFCRVNKKLYQITEELAGKGCGISQNSIDWIEQLW